VDLLPDNTVRIWQPGDDETSPGAAIVVHPEQVELLVDCLEAVSKQAFANGRPLDQEPAEDA
jgi:hypothetical protein